MQDYFFEVYTKKEVIRKLVMSRLRNQIPVS